MARAACGRVVGPGIDGQRWLDQSGLCISGAGRRNNARAAAVLSGALMDSIVIALVVGGKIKSLRLCDYRAVAGWRVRDVME